MCDKKGKRKKTEAQIKLEQVEKLDTMIKNKLTDRRADRGQAGGHCAGCSVPDISRANYRLRELEQADKEGRVVVLPCKVGDTVYFAAWFGTRPHVVKRIADPYFYTDDAECMGSSADFYLRDFGKSVFLTQEEAEAALKGEGHETP